MPNKEVAVPVGWPKGKRLAVFVNVMLEGWLDDAAPDIGPMGNPLKAGHLDTQARSWARYGPTTGMPRLLNILQKRKMKATVFTSGIIAEKYPTLVRQVVEEGHEVCGHSYAQNILPVYLDERGDRENIERCRRVLFEVTGGQVKGWGSPRCTPGLTTAQHLSESHFLWHNDVFDSDLPYLQLVGADRLVAVPFTMEVNDMPLYVRYGNTPQTYSQILNRLVTKWYNTHDTVGCLDVTVHAHVFGRPYGAIEFEEALNTIKSQEWIWTPTHEEVAKLFL